MHPALSVIVFTSLSGAGYGLLFLIGALTGTPILPESRWFAFFGIGMALGMATLGLLASTFHLGRPPRAWRAFSQWRSSWLSREGIFSLVTFVPALLLGASWFFSGGIISWAGWLAAVLSVITIYCTAMIYASLKPVPRWHSNWVPLNYLLLALMSGALSLQGLLAIFFASSPAVCWFAIAAIVAAALAKIGYWRWIDHARPVSTSESATGLGALGKVRLLEAPHSEENYLMREMGHSIARKHARPLRLIALLLAFALPLVLTVLGIFFPGWPAIVATVLAAGSGMIGILVERWLFFA
ncbi:MAG TPA: DmsC/YnfH family molybdoenzyme membrane anchor subunit, partial [Dongiaceae bacterium]|nr:DmsC/YnfH family molybdoenzyme membrane anchor subunit [Dongiaceae bacterium]